MGWVSGSLWLPQGGGDLLRVSIPNVYPQDMGALVGSFVRRCGPQWEVSVSLTVTRYLVFCPGFFKDPALSDCLLILLSNSAAYNNM